MIYKGKKYISNFKYNKVKCFLIYCLGWKWSHVIRNDLIAVLCHNNLVTKQNHLWFQFLYFVLHEIIQNFINLSFKYKMCLTLQLVEEENITYCQCVRCAEDSIWNSFVVHVTTEKWFHYVQKFCITCLLGSG